MHALGLRAALLAGAACALGAPSPQPETSRPPTGEQPPAQQTTQDDQTSPEDRAALRERLVRRLEQMRGFESYIEGAIRRLDEGADTEEIRRSFRPETFDRGRRPPPPGDEWADPNAPSLLDDPERFDAFLAKHLPDMRDRLATLAERDPDLVDRIKHRIARHLSPIAPLEERDPELFELRLDEFRVGAEILDASREYREILEQEGADPQHVADARKALAELLVRHFDLQMASQRHELSTLEDRVNALRQELADMESSREKAIADRLKWFTEPHKWRSDRDDRGPDDRGPDRRPDRDGG